MLSRRSNHQFANKEKPSKRPKSSHRKLVVPSTKSVRISLSQSSTMTTTQNPGQAQLFSYGPQG
jgi:hypothetical protein